MKMLTLEELQKRSINDFYMAIINCPQDCSLPVADLSEEELAEINEKLENTSPEEKEAMECLFGSIARAKNYLAKTLQVLKASLTNIDSNVVIVKVGDKYQNLSVEDIDFVDEGDILFMEPFSKYYKEGEYRFVMHNGRPTMDVDSLEPISEFEKVYAKKMKVKLTKLPFPTDE